jgi:hypothetical protein
MMAGCLWFAYMVAEALYTSSITFVSSQGSGTVYLSRQPGLFWYGIAFYSICSIGCAIAMWVCRDLHTYID